MSGGELNYTYAWVDACVERTEDKKARRILEVVSQYLHDLEWWLSGDYSDETYQEKLKEFKTNITSIVKDTDSDSDPVKNPSHYKKDSIECIDAMERTFGRERTKDFCLLNAYKYLWRCPFKGKLEEDRKKAMWYLNKAEELERYTNESSTI